MPPGDRGQIGPPHLDRPLFASVGPDLPFAKPNEPRYQTLAVRNKALSVLAGTVRASELVPALLDLDDTEPDDAELDDNGRGRGDRRQGAHQDGVVVAVDNLSDLTRCVDNLS
jgi:hypothetical protein